MGSRRSAYLMLGLAAALWTARVPVAPVGPQLEVIARHPGLPAESMVGAVTDPLERALQPWAKGPLLSETVDGMARLTFRARPGDGVAMENEVRAIPLVAELTMGHTAVEVRAVEPDRVELDYELSGGAEPGRGGLERLDAHQVAPALRDLPGVEGLRARPSPPNRASGRSRPGHRPRPGMVGPAGRRGDPVRAGCARGQPRARRSAGTSWASLDVPQPPIPPGARAGAPRRTRRAGRNRRDPGRFARGAPGRGRWRRAGAGNQSVGDPVFRGPPVGGGGPGGGGAKASTRCPSRRLEPRRRKAESEACSGMALVGGARSPVADRWVAGARRPCRVAGAGGRAPSRVGSPGWPPRAGSMGVGSAATRARPGAGSVGARCSNGPRADPGCAGTRFRGAGGCPIHGWG